MRAWIFTLVAISSFSLPAISRAENPLEWFLRNNGWGWSDGYHSRNNCVKMGATRFSYAPVVSSPGYYYQPAPAMPAQPMFSVPPRPQQQPTPAMQPESLPPPMRGPMMNQPGNNTPGVMMDNRSAQRRYPTW